MHVFAILLLLGLGTAAVVNFADRFLAGLHQVWTIFAVGIGVGLAWLANFNVWNLWAFNVPEDWIGVTLTGLAIGGTAVVWREVVGLLASLFRKWTDEAATLEKGQDLRRIA
jgi:hypothetical protein